MKTIEQINKEFADREEAGIPPLPRSSDASSNTALPTNSTTKKDSVPQDYDTANRAGNVVAKVNDTGKNPTSGAKRPIRILSNILFYLAIVSMVIAAFIYATNGSGAKNFFGYSYFTVLSESMQSEIPKGSLIVTKSVDPNTIKIGDDVTFLKNDNTTVTHRVVDIIENHEDSGARGFQTKGIENPMADSDIVYAANVIGVVVFHTAAVGDALSYIGENLLFIFAVFAMLLILSFSLRIFFGANKEEKAAKKG